MNSYKLIYTSANDTQSTKVIEANEFFFDDGFALFFKTKGDKYDLVFSINSQNVFSIEKVTESIETILNKPVK